MVKYTLYFGCNKDNKPFVTLPQFQTFCTFNISERFSGFTVQQGTGFWEKAMEKCFIVTIMAQKEQDYILCKTICEEYCRDFEQESVMLVKEYVSMELVGK